MSAPRLTLAAAHSDRHPASVVGAVEFFEALGGVVVAVELVVLADRHIARRVAHPIVEPMALAARRALSVVVARILVVRRVLGV